MNDNELTTEADDQKQTATGKFKKILGTVVWSLISALVVLSGLAYISVAAFPSILIIILGVLLIPYSRNRLKEKVPLLAGLPSPIYYGTVLISFVWLANIAQDLKAQDDQIRDIAKSQEIPEEVAAECLTVNEEIGTRVDSNLKTLADSLEVDRTCPSVVTELAARGFDNFESGRDLHLNNGFSNKSRADEAMAAGFNTEASYATHLDALERGFESIEQAEIAMKSGFETKAEYDLFLAEREKKISSLTKNGFSLLLSLRDLSNVKTPESCYDLVEQLEKTPSKDEAAARNPDSLLQFYATNKATLATFPRADCATKGFPSNQQTMGRSLCQDTYSIKKVNVGSRNASGLPTESNGIRLNWDSFDLNSRTIELNDEPTLVCSGVTWDRPVGHFEKEGFELICEGDWNDNWNNKLVVDCDNRGQYETMLNLAWKNLYQSGSPYADGCWNAVQGLQRVPASRGRSYRRDPWFSMCNMGLANLNNFTR